MRSYVRHNNLAGRPPETYLGVGVPAHVKAAWRRWAGAEWRKTTYMQARNRTDPPDERYNITPPGWMCAAHLADWTGRRGRNLDLDRSGYWQVGMGQHAAWDDDAGRGMRAVEEICAQRRSCRGSPTRVVRKPTNSCPPTSPGVPGGQRERSARAVCAHP